MPHPGSSFSAGVRPMPWIWPRMRGSRAATSTCRGEGGERGGGGEGRHQDLQMGGRRHGVRGESHTCT